MTTKISGSGFDELTIKNLILTKPLVEEYGGTGVQLFETKAKTALNASGTAPIYACRAWVNFNGTGTVSIRASGNVSSITDNGVGDYTVNFLTAMPDANYAYQGSAARGVGGNYFWGMTTQLDIPNFLVSSLRVRLIDVYDGTATTDSAIITLSVFR